MTTIDYGSLSRDETIHRIKDALQRRSGKPWSVRGDHGTAYGWITVNAPPRRWIEGYISDPDRAELATLLGVEHVHHQGVSIAASHDYYREYIDRAEGRTPAKVAEPYWD